MSKYNFPKVDLHLHLDGSMLPESAWEMAAERGIRLPAETLEDFRQFIVVTADCRSVNEYLKRFEMPLQILQDRVSLGRTAFELVSLLAGQGLRYAEIRFAPQLHLRKGLTQRDAVEAVLAGVKRGIRAFLILSSTSLKSMIPLFSRNAKVSSGVKDSAGSCVSVVTAVTALVGAVINTVSAVTAVTEFKG